MSVEGQAVDAIVGAAAHAGAQVMNVSVDASLKIATALIALTASGMKNLAMIAAANITGESKTKGCLKLENMLAVDSNVSSFKLDKERLRDFNHYAEQYGLPYAIAHNRNDENAKLGIIFHLAKAPMLNIIIAEMGLAQLPQMPQEQTGLEQGQGAGQSFIHANTPSLSGTEVNALPENPFRSAAKGASASNPFRIREELNKSATNMEEENIAKTPESTSPSQSASHMAAPDGPEETGGIMGKLDKLRKKRTGLPPIPVIDDERVR